MNVPIDRRLRSGLLLIPLLSLAAIARAASTDLRVVLDENFESYPDTAALLEVWQNGTANLQTAPGGGKAVLHDGGDLNIRGGFTIQADAAHNVIFSVDLYSFDTNTDKRVTVALRNLNGANVEFGQVSEVGTYAMRLTGLAGDSPWIPIDAKLKPVRGWHRFKVVISTTNAVVTLDLQANGSVDRTLTFTGRGPVRPFTQVRFGGLPGRTSHDGPLMIDNIRVELVPADEPEPVLVARAPLPAPVTETQVAPTTAPVVTPALAPAPVATTPTTATTPLPLATTDAGQNWQTIAWFIAGGLGVIIVLLAWLVMMFRRSGLHGSTALVPLGPGTTPGRYTDSSPSDEWKERALSAEALADKQAQILREKMVPELTEFAKQSLVQGLHTQRNDLIETQQHAQQELASLEHKLASLHLPLKERIHAYEKRINELETELDTRGDEMRELIRATLLLVRQRLEEEKEKDQARRRFN